MSSVPAAHDGSPRVVLVTGCSSGIGRATAERLAAHGWTVYATARRVDTLEALAAAGCRLLPLDVTDEASMVEAVRQVEATHGSIDALVNNAGYSQSGAVEAVSVERVRAQFETNVFGLLRLTQLVLPGMRRARRGTVVVLGSVGGKLVFPGGGVYHATKYALEALCDALRFELAGFGVRVVLIEPGLIRTHFAGTAVGSIDTGYAAAPDGTSMRPGPGSAYGRFHAEVARITREAYERGALAPLLGTADDVARVIEQALDTSRPKARYTVSPSATVLLFLRWLLPDSWWDRFLARTYVRPGDSAAR